MPVTHSANIWYWCTEAVNEEIHFLHTVMVESRVKEFCVTFQRAVIQ